jgi:glutathione synthase/RimK-type ligase-like ATP-grasp enzyme
MDLMTALGLRFGALDFLLTPDDEWVFLEINPNGQWAFIEQATGLPIAAAIADALTSQEVPA